MATRADIIIVGAGMAGISLAGRLVDRLPADAKVVVLETCERPGMQATGRSAAQFVRNYGNTTLRHLTNASEAFLSDPSFVEERSFLTPRGVLFFAAGDDMSLFDAEVAAGEDLQLIDPKEALEMVPILRPEAVEAACLEPGAQDIDVDRMLQGFLRKARVGGADLVTGAEVTAISRGGDWHVVTKGETYRAPILVNAAGAWADQVAAMGGVAKRGLRALRRSAALLPMPEGVDVSKWPMMLPVAETWYAKPDAGNLMVSPADAEPVEPMDAWPDDMVLAEGLYRFEQAVTVPVKRVSHSWAGLRTFAPDDTPLVGFDGEADGFFWLAGQGGYGIQTAPALSELAAQLLLEEAVTLAPEIVAALDANRLLEQAA